MHMIKFKHPCILSNYAPVYKSGASVYVHVYLPLESHINIYIYLQTHKAVGAKTYPYAHTHIYMHSCMYITYLYR